MSVFSPTAFMANAKVAEKELKQVADVYITKYLGQSDARKFVEACHAMDDVTANRIIGKTIAVMGEASNASDALIFLADKFSPEIDVDFSSAYSEGDRIHVIRKYLPQMRQMMKRM